MYGRPYSKSIDQPGRVANPARGQLNRENGCFPVPVRACIPSAGGRIAAYFGALCSPLAYFGALCSPLDPMIPRCASTVAIIKTKKSVLRFSLKYPSRNICPPRASSVVALLTIDRRNFSTGTKGQSYWEKTSLDTDRLRTCRRCL